MDERLTGLLRGRGHSPAGLIALVVATSVMILAGAACSRSASPSERVVVDAKALYAQACAKCHAEDGTGGLPMVANGPRPIDLTSAEWQRSRSDVEVLAAIRTGRGAMPPFEGVLTVEQIAALGAHVRTLKRP